MPPKFCNVVLNQKLNIMKNILKNFGVTDEDPSVVALLATSRMQEKVKETMRQQINGCEYEVAKPIANKLTGMANDVSMEHWKVINPKITKLVQGSISISMDEHELPELHISTHRQFLLERSEIESCSKNPDTFVEEVNRGWIDPKTGKPLATLMVASKNTDEWTNYKNVRIHFTLCTFKEEEVVNS